MFLDEVRSDAQVNSHFLAVRVIIISHPTTSQGIQETIFLFRNTMTKLGYDRMGEECTYKIGEQNYSQS